RDTHLPAAAEDRERRRQPCHPGHPCGRLHVGAITRCLAAACHEASAKTPPARPARHPALDIERNPAAPTPPPAVTPSTPLRLPVFVSIEGFGFGVSRL